MRMAQFVANANLEIIPNTLAFHVMKVAVPNVDDAILATVVAPAQKRI